MMSICNRPNKRIKHPVLLSDHELYRPWHLATNQLYAKMPGNSLRKRLTDPWEHKEKLATINTYAD